MSFGCAALISSSAWMLMGVSAIGAAILCGKRKK